MPEQDIESANIGRAQDAITVRDLTKSFGSRCLWRNISFSIKPGQMLALLGPSGAGKSTLLNCLGLLEPVDRGEIRVNGKDVTQFGASAARRFRRDSLGYLFQNYALVDGATVYENLEIAQKARWRRTNRQDLEKVLDQVGLPGRGKEKVFRLSGGEQQRVALARLLVKQPSIILADEPTGALDSDNAGMVIDMLRGMASRGSSVIIATHDDNVKQCCDTALEPCVSGGPEVPEPLRL